MWRAFVPAVLAIGLALGLGAPATAAAAEPPHRPAGMVVVVSVPAVVYIGNIPFLVTTQQVVVVPGSLPLAVVSANGLYFVNGVPVAMVRPTRVIVVGVLGPPAS